jgi:uncharacterized protein (DUF342 family)
MAEQTTTTGAPPSFETRLSSDHLTLYVTAPDPSVDFPGTAARIAAELPKYELAVEIGADVLEDLLREVCTPGEHFIEYPLLTGDIPEPCRDGEIQWQDDYFQDGFACDEDTGRVDYWERAENRAVQADQLLAVVLLPLEGKSGRTLEGNEVPVAKPKPARLRAGKGVRTEETDDCIHVYAAVSGRVTLKDGNVSVDDVYAIRGDVGIETGNIHHTGALVVQGDVREGAQIECDGDVLIKGMVEPCRIVCGGNLTVGGGIVGDEDQRLDVAGSVQARYLNDVTLRCGGDVTVTSQIDHSEVECRGRVDVSRGRIAGSRVKAYKGVRVAHLGAAGATGTVIMAGADWQLEDRHRERKEKLGKLHEARDQITKAIAEITSLGALGDQARAQLDQLNAKVAQIDRALQAEAELQERENQESARDALREVAVLTTLWSGVTFVMGPAKSVSDRTYELPRLVTVRRDKVRILPMGELNTPD